MRFRAVLLLALLSACSFRHGSAPPADGAIDAPAPGDGAAAARSQRDVVNGAGRVHAGSITIDVEVGHGIPVKKSTAGTRTFDGSPAVRP
jgi:hypothetical protein